MPESTVKLRRDAVDPATVAAKIGWLNVKVNIGGQSAPVQGWGRKSIPTNVAFLVYFWRGKVMYQNRSIIIIAIIIVAISVVFSSRFIARARVYTLAHKTTRWTYTSGGYPSDYILQNTVVLGIMISLGGCRSTITD